MFQVHVNKYSHAGSAFDRTEGEPHATLQLAIDAATRAMKYQRFAFITRVNQHAKLWEAWKQDGEIESRYCTKEAVEMTTAEKYATGEFDNSLGTTN